MNKNLRTLYVALAAALAAGCGDAQNGAPEGSDIRFAPSALTLSNDDPYAYCYYSDPPSRFTITVVDKYGNLLNDMAISIDDGGMLLYDDMDNSGTLEGAELTPVADPYLTTTGPFGSKIVFVSPTMGGTYCVDPAGNATTGLNYTTDLGVFSGALFDKATVTVTSAAPPAAP